MDEDAGWYRIDGAFGDLDVHLIVDECERFLIKLRDHPGLVEVGDKIAGGTRRLTRVRERSVYVDEVLRFTALGVVAERILGTSATLVDVTYRCPRPGFGEQRLHADDLPRLDPTMRPTKVTGIVALNAFTEENGATRVVPGSHLRPDLQRLSGSLDSHPDEVVLIGPPASAFLFDTALLHGGGMNRSPKPRPALQLQWEAEPGRT